MDFLTKANLEEWLVKKGFKRWHEGKDGWYSGQFPTMRFVDLSVEPPWVGIKTGHSSQEYDHDCEDVPLIREKILTIFNAKDLAKNAENAEKKKNDIKKSGVRVGEGNVISKKPLAEPPSKPAPKAEKAPDESHEEVIEMSCKGKGCKRKVSKQDGVESFKKYDTVLCYDCIQKREESSKKKTNNCSDCGLELSMLRAEEQYRKKIPVSKFKCEDCEEKKRKSLADEMALKKEEPDHEIKKEAEGKQKEPEKEEKPMTEPEFKDTVICTDCGVSLSQERIDQLAEYKIPIGEMSCAGCFKKRKEQKAGNIQKSSSINNQEPGADLLEYIKSYVNDDVLEIFGDSGTGKSKFAVEVARQAVASGKKVFYLDTERNLSKEEVVKLQGCQYKYTPLISEIGQITRTLPKVDLFIIDSIGFPILTAYARMSMKQKGDALLNMIAIFGDLKEWAYKNNSIAIVVNQPESDFNKAPDHLIRPFGDKSQFAAKEIWKTEVMQRGSVTKTDIRAFRSRSVGHKTLIARMEVSNDGTKIITEIK